MIVLSAINNAGVHSDHLQDITSCELGMYTGTDSLYGCILTASPTQPSRLWVLGSPVLGSLSCIDNIPLGYVMVKMDPPNYYSINKDPPELILLQNMDSL